MNSVPDAKDRPVVCVQGLGFVGMAMALATASARREGGSPSFDVIGVEIDDAAGRERAEAVNAGRLPIRSSDGRMVDAMRRAVEAGNLRATTDPSVYARARVAIVDVGLDVTMTEDGPTVDFTGLRAAVRALAERLPEGALIIVETTVPP
jgi:UDP-N-acetyl-D-mannosaminuronate dehydrogenase